MIFADDGNSIGSPRNAHGVSLHFYSKGWLEADARKGSLFAYHVAFEGVALRDDGGFLTNLRVAFRKKPSYAEDRHRAVLILRLLLEQNWHDNHEARKRYFWAIRTILVCQSAELGTPAFASGSLEVVSAIEGLARHIDFREKASFAECEATGREVLAKFGVECDPALHGARLRDHLMTLGGVARDTVRIVEEREAIEVGGAVIYL